MHHVKLTGLTLLLAVFYLGAGCSTVAEQESTFSYDKNEFAKAKPWTAKEFQNDPMQFQFAVIGDRTGGADAQGVFSRAIDQLNLLQPEFVINVGDSVEGYSDDKGELNDQWDEFDSMVEKLQMPFFRTVGNHDMSNELMREVWHERYGPTHYHFLYGDVLFLVLNTEDIIRPAPEGMDEKIKLYNRLQVEDPAKAAEMLEDFMKDESVVAALGQPVEFPAEQIAYIKNVLNENPDVRWTFIFLHSPVWENPSDSFLAIENLLADRKYTFFAGHLHYYNFERRNDRDYITMGPAGASFHHEGPGNVDHIMWVTMGEDGPEIAKITLDGIFDRQGRDLEVKEIYERKGW